jgi:hypothetical protein
MLYTLDCHQIFFVLLPVPLYIYPRLVETRSQAHRAMVLPYFINIWDKHIKCALCFYISCYPTTYTVMLLLYIYIIRIVDLLEMSPNKSYQIINERVVKKKTFF